MIKVDDGGGKKRAKKKKTITGYIINSDPLKKNIFLA